MAVTIYDEPQDISPAGNPLMFTFSSDQTGQDNFSFIIEVYVNAALHSTHQVFRQFGTLSKFDCSGILASTLLNLDITTDFEFDATNSMSTYAIVVYEKYGDPAITQASATSSTLKAFNGSLRHQDWIDWDYTIYDPNQTQDAVFLTDFPTSQKAFCGIEENFYLGYFEESGIAGVSFIIDLYDINGVVTSGDSFGLTSTEFNILNVGPTAIAAASPVLTITDFSSDCYYYEFRVDVGGVSQVGPFRIYVDKDCKRYETRRLHWLNKYGVWDSFTFSLVSIDSSTVQSYGYQREKGIWDGTSYTYPLYQGEKTTFAKTASDQLILNSDFIKQEVQQWLVRGLYESPVVYLEVENGTEFEPVNVTNSNYQFKTRRRDGLIQEQITIERTYTYTSQLN
jgi:hypothetical protein